MALAHHGALAHARLGLDHLLARHHFGDDEPRAKPSDKPSERQIGDSGHWGQEHGRRERDVSKSDTHA